MKDLGVVVLRVGLGIMFFLHGLQLSFGLYGGPGVRGFAKALSGMGFAPAMLWAVLAAATTLVGGILLIAGISIRASSFSLLIFILVAAIKVHIAKGFFLQQGGFEYNFIIACALVSLGFSGPDQWSLFKKL